MMKFSVITATFNSESTLEETILSVLRQKYPNVEYIIKDGLSKDGTLKIAEKYQDGISKIESRKDSGIYDALNQGLELVTGDIIGILHSDDIYLHENVFDEVATVFEKEKCDAVYSNLFYVKREDLSSIVRRWHSGKYKDGRFLKGWMPPHPTLFVRKEIYERYGNFNTDFKTAADYEIMLRFIHKWKIKISYLNDFTVKMRVGGQSNISLENRILANKEDRKAWRVNGLKPYFYTLTLKPIRKIFQFF